MFLTLLRCLRAPKFLIRTALSIMMCGLCTITAWTRVAKIHPNLFFAIINYCRSQDPQMKFCEIPHTRTLSNYSTYLLQQHSANSPTVIAMQSWLIFYDCLPAIVHYCRSDEISSFGSDYAIQNPQSTQRQYTASRLRTPVCWRTTAPETGNCNSITAAVNGSALVELTVLFLFLWSSSRESSCQIYLEQVESRHRNLVLEVLSTLMHR